MQEPNPYLRVNPGGMLTPGQVVGRDALITTIWRALEPQSVLLTSERRMGKTSVMRKMTQEPPLGSFPIQSSLQGINEPEEFARRLVADVETNLPDVLSESVVGRLRKAGVRRMGAKSVEVEFDPAGDDAWKDVVVETLASVDSGVDERVVFFWDELPHMIDAIVERRDAATGRDVLDVLRYVRETFPSIRMVLSGSLGMHHVVDKLRLQGGMWVPTHDMVLIDVPPLGTADAAYLAVELLRNEGIACEEEIAVAETVATEIDRVPYYIHHTVAQLQYRRDGGAEPVAGETAREVVEAVLGNPQDPWQLKHYVDRVPVYYPKETELAYTVLDVIAAAPGAVSQEEIEHLLAAHMAPPEQSRLRGLLELLCKDHYVEPGYRFRLDLVRRAWQARRPPR